MTERRSTSRRPSASFSPLAPLVFTAIATFVAAQETRPSDDMFEFTIQADGMSIETLISNAEAVTGKSFIYNDATGLKGKTVKMLGSVRVPKAEAFGFFQALFITQQYALVPLGDEDSGLFLIENIDSGKTIKQRAPYVPHTELARYRNEVGQVIMTSIPLKYVKVSNIRSAYTQILSNRASEITMEVDSANSIIVVAFAPTVYALKQIIDVMDVPQVSATMKFEIVGLKYAVAEELQPIITELIEGDSQSSSGSQGQRQPRLVAQGGEQGQAGVEKPPPKIIADARTNSLIVYAVESDLNQIKRLVSALDNEVRDPIGNIRIYFLKNTNAEDLQETLQDVIGQASGARGSRPTGGVRTGNNQGPSSTDARGQEVSIVADKTNNALIITATKTRYEEIEDIIKKLDQRRPQVLVQAAIAELSDSDVRNIGVELTAVQGGGGDYKSAFATGFGLSTVQVSGTSANINSLTRVPLSSGGSINVDGGVFGIFDKNLNVPLLVSLLKTRQKSNLVSVPSILTNDNEESVIEVGRQVGTADFNTTGAGTDQQGFGGYEDAKIELRISPHISNDNYLRLKVELTVEAFVGQRISAQIPPDKTSRKLVGSVTLPSGRTVVIGGLVQDNDTTTEQAVPFLSDIPLLGELFKRTETVKEKTTLYVFITPTIFTDFDGVEDVSYDRKLEVMKLDGQVRLLDPNFRPVMFDYRSTTIDDLEGSGTLDLPRYAPTAPTGVDDLSPDRLPTRPRANPADVGTKPASAPLGGKGGS
jgi:general secretion pathway protein D